MVVRVDIGTYTHKRLQMVLVSSITKPGSSIDPYSLKTFLNVFIRNSGNLKSCLIWADEGSRLSSVLSDGNDVKANNCKFKICIYPSIENHWNNFAKFLNFKIVRVRTLPELLLTVPQALGFSDEFHEFCFGDWSYGSVLPAALAVTGQGENIFSSPKNIFSSLLNLFHHLHKTYFPFIKLNGREG